MNWLPSWVDWKLVVDSLFFGVVITLQRLIVNRKERECIDLRIQVADLRTERAYLSPGCRANGCYCVLMSDEPKPWGTK